MHHCDSPASCEQIEFDNSLVCNPTTGATAWHIDGKRLVYENEKFIAISHTWADGTGAPIDHKNASDPDKVHVNKCLFSYFAKPAKDRDFAGIWWDAISLPKNNGPLRKQAVATMHEMYAKAGLTLVHDRFLLECAVRDDMEFAARPIILSPWFSRAWTALELPKCKKVIFIFKDGEFDLDDENVVANLNELLIALNSRHSTYTSDLPIIAGLLTGVSVEGLTSPEIYQRIVRALKRIPCQHLLHNEIGMDVKSFCWCPSNLLTVPKALGRPELLAKADIASDGAAAAVWRVVDLNETTRPELEQRERAQSPNIEIGAILTGTSTTITQHLLLLDLYDRNLKKAVIVKVKNSRTSEIHCQYIGTVRLKRILEDDSFGAVKLTIGDTSGMSELGQETAVDYVQRVWKLRQGKKQGKLRLGPKRVGSGW
ncbi:uncharacterized protein BJX67DRAFT_382945 [Aspergillus lucknowensis]|uniref:Heterokaryon incompatibility domain-containing protein n=1 Tax=Aspergillus lucknowensis TaxID=176173 RepID=A0ABR4LLF0_9EURO